MTRRYMAGDPQVGPGFRPGFGQQPAPVPAASPEQQSPQPVDAVSDHADLPFRPLPTAAAPILQRLRQRPQVAWVNPAVLGVLHPRIKYGAGSGAAARGQRCRHRQRRSVAGDTGRAGEPGLAPLSSQALEGLEALFNPEAQGVPAHPGLPGRQAGGMIQGSSCPAYRTTGRAQRRWAGDRRRCSSGSGYLDASPGAYLRPQLGAGDAPVA